MIEEYSGVMHMQATITAGMNSQNNMAINHTNKSLTRRNVKHTVRNSTQIYCVVIHSGLSVSFIFVQDKQQLVKKMISSRL